MSTRPFDELGLSATPEWFVANEPRTWMSQIRCDCDAAVKIAIAVVDLVLPSGGRTIPTIRFQFTRWMRLARILPVANRT
jgi:hypothetical protein